MISSRIRTGPAIVESSPGTRIWGVCMPDAAGHGVPNALAAWMLRWLSLMLLPEIPWAGRCWALPSDCPGPSERYWQQHKSGKRQHKKLTDWGRTSPDPGGALAAAQKKFNSSAATALSR